MKYLHSTSIVLTFGAASAKPSSHSNDENGPRSIAGLRELRKLAHKNERGLFGDLLSGFGGPECGDTCSDPDKCTSFMSTPSSSVLEESCDAGCVPEIALSTCDQLCGDDDAATVSVQRLGLFDAAADLVCGNCEFYKCCAGDGASYEACEGLLPDEEDFPEVDSLLPDFGLGDVLDLDSFLPDFGDSSSDTPGLDLDAFLPDGFPDMDSIVPDWDDASNGSGSASILSILGQLGGMVGDSACPESCADSELCDFVLIGMSGMGGKTLKDACNAGCIPAISSAFCEDTCRNVGEPKFMDSVVDVACDACRFVECCAGDGSDSENFDDCKELLPTMGGLVPYIDLDAVQIQTVLWNLTDWGTGLDWSSVASGLSESLVEAIHLLFDETLGDFQVMDNFDSFPVTCNPETCPIDGLCAMDAIHLSSIDFEDACKTNAFFECAEGLEELCANECDAAMSDNFLSASFCSMCNIAECCRDNGGAKTFEDCAWGAIPGEISDAIDDIADVVENITGSIADAFGQPSGLDPEELNESEAPVEASLAKSSESLDTSANDSDSDSLDDPIVATFEDSLPEDLTVEVSSEVPADTPTEASASGLVESPGGPTEASASETPNVSAVSRMEANVGFGLRTSGVLTILAAVSIAALAFVSF